MTSKSADDMLVRRMTVNMHDEEGQEIIRELIDTEEEDTIDRNTDFAESTWRRSYLMVS